MTSSQSRRYWYDYRPGTTRSSTSIQFESCQKQRPSPARSFEWLIDGTSTITQRSPGDTKVLRTRDRPWEASKDATIDIRETLC